MILSYVERLFQLLSCTHVFKKLWYCVITAKHRRLVAPTFFIFITKQRYEILSKSLAGHPYYWKPNIAYRWSTVGLLYIHLKLYNTIIICIYINAYTFN